MTQVYFLNQFIEGDAVIVSRRLLVDDKFIDFGDE